MYAILCARDRFFKIRGQKWTNFTFAYPIPQISFSTEKVDPDLSDILTVYIDYVVRELFKNKGKIPLKSHDLIVGQNGDCQKFPFSRNGLLLWEGIVGPQAVSFCVFID